MKDFEKNLTYQEKAKIYNENFSLGYINSDINEKLALIALIGYTVMKIKKKTPTATYLQVVYKIASGMCIPEDFLDTIAVIAEDFSYGCTNFPTFGLKDKEIIPKIKDILNKYVPF